MFTFIPIKVILRLIILIKRKFTWILYMNIKYYNGLKSGRITMHLSHHFIFAIVKINIM